MTGVRRICSFSEAKALNSQLMWGHYAEAGMGIAIEIEAHPISPLEKVEYDKKDRHNSVVEILTNKSSQWYYEHEWRHLSTDPCAYYKTDITKIYFGTPYSGLVNYDEIRRKHRKLQEYLRRSLMLKEECSMRGIPCEDYQLVV